jgi:hypothetical protein
VTSCRPVGYQSTTALLHILAHIAHMTPAGFLDVGSKRQPEAQHLVGPLRAAVAELPHCGHAHPHQAPAGVCQHQEWTNAGPHPQAQIPEAAQPFAGEILCRLRRSEDPNRRTEFTNRLQSTDYTSHVCPSQFVMQLLHCHVCINECRVCAKTLMWRILCALHSVCSNLIFLCRSLAFHATNVEQIIFCWLL